MRPERQKQTVTQFRGLHAMSATTPAGSATEKSKRTAPAAAPQTTAAAPKRNAA